ncbi:MAG: hypothetical protein PHC28_13475 [Flavobacterium sp.]|uniref:hypothetical protein n=1 Tax=Flavobacterium sp. TaxID=239 RepID=UPI00262183CB|nr:hypothetical protein [Flavobacterium sp.]MDD5151463.1 hypothetical protein [Flavobacterium sp.]
MRYKIFRWFKSKSKVEHGEIVPTWLFFIKIILFPEQFLYYYIGKHTGYDFNTDTWNIHGIRYSDELLGDLGMLYNGLFTVVKRENGCITIHRLE